MELALISAFGVGGATIAGVIIGFFFQKIPHKFNDAILGFAAGIMLSAAILGLIIPSLEEGNVWVTAVGILAGTIFLNLADKLTPHLHHITGVDHETHADRQSNLNKVMLFVMGIALQNIPEGMVIVSPLIMAGVARKRVFFIACFTGVVEIVGTMIGFGAVSIATVILPFALAFAGGTMLYVVSDEMIPETHSHGYERMATYSLIIGFLTMLIMDFYIG